MCLLNNFRYVDNKLYTCVLHCSLLLRFTEDRFDPEQSATIGKLCSKYR